MPAEMRRKSSDAIAASRQVPHRRPKPLHVILKRAQPNLAPRGHRQPANVAVGRPVDPRHSRRVWIRSSLEHRPADPTASVLISKEPVELVRPGSPPVRPR